jgi:hypothetical protein
MRHKLTTLRRVGLDITTYAHDLVRCARRANIDLSGIDLLTASAAWIDDLNIELRHLVPSMSVTHLGSYSVDRWEQDVALVLDVDLVADQMVANRLQRILDAHRIEATR